MLESGLAVEAELAYREIVMQDPAHAVASLGRARAYEQLQNWPAAYAWFLRAIALDPGSSDAQLGALRLELRSRQWQLARQRFPDVTWQDPVERVRALARIETGIGREQEALVYLQKASLTYPELLPEAAMAARRADSMTLARTLLEKARLENVNNREMARARFFIEEDAEALFQWLDQAPDDVEMTVLAVEFLLRTGQLNRAADRLNVIEDKQADVPELALLRIEILALQGKADAIDGFLSTLSRSDATWRGIELYGMGLVALHQAAFEQARDQLKQADSILRNRGRLMVTLGLLTFANGNWKEAQDYLSRGIRQLPFSPRARTVLAEVSLRLGDYREAARQSERVLMQLPDDRSALVVLARARDYQGYPEEALAAIYRIPRKDLKQQDLVFAARLNLRTGRYLEVGNLVESLASENNEALLTYIDSLNARGEFAAARQWLTRQSLPLARDIEVVLALQANRTQEALKLSEAVSDTPGGRLLRISALEQAGLAEDALETALRGDSPAARLKAGALLVQQDQHQRALPIFQSLQASAPESSIVMNNLAWVLYRLDLDLDEALVLARRAYLAEPGNEKYRNTLAAITDRIKETDNES
ncbi:MAG: hypothetical protein O3B72_03280 [Proteobacteria bacterium]|nr:hypothetical protein [Pseudomonadota bacterium]